MMIVSADVAVHGGKTVLSAGAGLLNTCRWAV